jgi:putative GTP pyrophosphokinase
MGAAEGAVSAKATISGEAAVIPMTKAREEYFLNEKSYRRLLTEIEFSLNAELAARGVKVHSVTGRVKDVDSFLEKVQRKGYEEPHAQTPDIVGARIVALFISDLKLVETAVESLFQVVEKVDHIDGGRVEEFGYMSVHYVCKLGNGHSGPRYAGLGEYVFEIQVRTIVMDAWANISHHLGYKGDSTIAADLRRDFYALSGLFYVADQHFELFFNRSQETEETAEEAIESKHAGEMKITLESLSALLRVLYPDRRRTNRTLIAEFVNEIHAAGYMSIGQLLLDLRRGQETAVDHEIKNPPSGTPDRRYTDLGIARRTLYYVNPAFKEIMHNKASQRKKEGQA